MFVQEMDTDTVLRLTEIRKSTQLPTYALLLGPVADYNAFQKLPANSDRYTNRYKQGK